MKIARQQSHQQRFQLDLQLKAWSRLKETPPPRGGWLRAIRESLGLSTRQLGEFLGTGNASVLRLESREAKGTVTLETLDRAARAMGCRLVYAIVPGEGSLEEIVDRKAAEAAKRLLAPVEHSMRLENQGVSESVASYQARGLAQELKSRLGPELWNRK